MNQNFWRSDITYGIKKDQNVESHVLTFDVLIFDFLIFQHSDHPKNTFDVLTLWCSDFQRSDPLPFWVLL